MEKQNKQTKIKPIRFDDTWNHAEKKLADRVLTTKAIICGDYSEHGRSYYSIKCGFCSGYFDAFKWSLRGGGKRCPHCKALMGSTFDMYQWEKLVNKEKVV